MTGQDTPSWDLAGLSDSNEPEEEKVIEEPKKEIALPPIDAPSSGGELLAAIAQNSGVEIPKEQLGVLDKFMRNAKYGHQASIAMQCKGLHCSVIKMCPLHAIAAKLPEGQPCPVENALVEQWVATYVQALDIDPANPTDAIDMHMVYELAGLELLRTRTAHKLSTDPDVCTEKVVGYSPQGEPFYDDKPSIPMLLMEKQAKVVGKLRESLLATRKAQAQVGIIAGDVSVKASTIMEKAAKIRAERAERRNNKIADAEFEVKDENTNTKPEERSSGDESPDK